MRADSDAQQVNTFIMVGHETTAGSLAFTLLELARHPEVQSRLRDEIRTKGGDLSYNDIQRLTYLDAVVKEGYAPPAPRVDCTTNTPAACACTPRRRRRSASRCATTSSRCTRRSRRRRASS